MTVPRSGELVCHPVTPRRGRRRLRGHGMMDGMQISSRLDFEADPKTVYEMMTDKGWLTELVSRTGATSHTIDVAGPTTRIDMALPAPSEVSKFVGSALNLQQVIEWGPAAADGSREGTLAITVPGLPVTMDGRAEMRPGGRGTVVDYSGDFQVRIPLMGKKIEQQASPYVKQAIDAQQEAGDDWIAARG